MVVLAILKLQNVEGFSTMFLNYDLLAKRWVRYGFIYPFAEAGASVLMVTGALHCLIPHHQGAIDMAKVKLQFGNDAGLRKLSEDIVKAQESEIAGMKDWQAKNAK